MLYRSPAALPDSFDRVPIFIAGGISNCPDWQSQLASMIDTDEYDVINPRRDGDLAKTGEEARKQIAWEHRALEESLIVLFWFPKETLCPITLFEYGKMLERACKEGVRIIAGYDPDYQRAFDLEVQTQLALDWTADDDIRVDIVSGWKAFTALVQEELGKRLE